LGSPNGASWQSQVYAVTPSSFLTYHAHRLSGWDRITPYAGSWPVSQTSRFPAEDEPANADTEDPNEGRWYALGLLGPLLQMGTTFHYNRGLHSYSAEGEANTCASRMVEGYRDLSYDFGGSRFINLAAPSPLASAGGASQIVGRVSSTGWCLLAIGVSDGWSPNLKTGFSGATRVRRVGDCEYWRGTGGSTTMPDQPTLTPPPAPGTRTISPEEAFQIFKRMHDTLGWDFGSASTRDQRVAWFVSAIAVIHYGHATFNAAGGDSDWCMKDAGSGRPPSEDVMARCSNRQAYDMIVSSGADGYVLSLTPIGRLPDEQNIYAPPRSALPA
jgi:hypothetical protein